MTEPENSLPPFGQWLKTKLSQKGKKQNQLADAIGLTPSQISRLISGERGTDIETLRRISGFLNLPFEEILQAYSRTPVEEHAPLSRIIASKVDRLPAKDQEDVNEYVEMRLRLAEQRGKYEPSESADRENRKIK